MKKLFKILLYILLGILILAALGWLYFNSSYYFDNKTAKAQLVEKPILNLGGFQFKDLNNNGELDIYEDSRQDIAARVEDLLSQMTVEEKTGLMWHPPIGMGTNGEILAKPSPEHFFFGSTYDMIITRKMRHFNLFKIAPPEKHAEWYNAVQKIAEEDRLGIPLTISSDPRHGANNFLAGGLLDSEFSKWPEPIGLAAMDDSLLTVEFGQLASAELKAVGIRTALHPMADLATEPRWARINGTFGEDAALSSRTLAAYINGFQNGALNPGSVACMTKHWPGGGPQKDGEDAHFRYGKDQAYPGNNFDYHLEPFKAAFEAQTAMIMPYYGVPVGQTSEDVGMSFNKEIITDLLRKEYGYDGIVCTDWGILQGFEVMGKTISGAKDFGVEELTVKGRIQKAIEAGVDQFGGNDNTVELVELVKEGSISEARIDESVRRLLRAKFQMGLFDNPYVDVSKVSQVIANKEAVSKGLLAQKKSLVLLKNETKADGTMALPLSQNLKIYTENIKKEVASKYAEVVDSLDDADLAILRIAAPFEPRNTELVESFFHQGDLDFKEPEKSRILNILKTKPTIVCIYLDRAAVIPEIAAEAQGLIADFGTKDEAVLEVIFGNFNPRGKLPFELPSSMEAVKNQKEDLPYDSVEPLFEFGFGLSYEVF